MKLHYGWVVVAAGALMGCVAIGCLFTLAVFLQPMSEATGWSRTGISTAMTIDFLAMGVAAFGWGALTDRFGPKIVVLSGAVLLGLGLVLASRTTSLLQFQLVYGLIVGVAAGAIFAPTIATVTGWFDKHRSLAVSLVSIGGGVAPMVVTPLASVLIGIYGWRMAMLMIAIGASAIIIPAGFLIRRAPEAVAAPQVSGTVEHAAVPRETGIGSVMRKPQFIVLAGTFFLCCAAHSGPIFHTVSYAMLCGASALAAASIYSVEGVAGLFGRLIFGVLADRLGVKRVIIGGLVLQALGIYTYIYVTQLQDFYMLAVVLGLAYGGVMPLYAVLARDYFPAHFMGTVLGGITMTASLGMAFGPVGGGWIFDTFGDYHWLYVSSAAIGLAAAAVALTFPRPSVPNEGQLQPA